MLQLAPKLSTVQRGQLAVAANQVEVDTNQIEVARSQYAIGLNQIFQDGKPLADRLGSLCNSAPPPQFDQVCGQARAAADSFNQSFDRGRKIFLPYKRAVQDELSHQSEMVRRMENQN
jgi:hypothetical protein